MPTLEAMNPSTGEEFANIEMTPIEQIPGILDRARGELSDWRTRTVAERLPYLRALRHTIVEELDHCVDIIAKDTGKPKMEAMTSEILTTLDAIKYTEDNAEQILQTRKVKTTLLLMGKKSYIAYRPRGVVLVISPWNYPFFLSIVPVISALAAGNSVILKPSEVTPAVGELMMTLFEKAGFPSGTVQVAHGEGDVGSALVEASPDYIFFTGSVPTGKAIQQEAAKQLIPTTLELGGKDPMIVFRDANLERAANGAVWGAMTNSGQMCMGTERLYVEESIYEEFVALLKKKTEELVQDESENADLGSMTFPKQLKIVKEHVTDALSRGAKMMSGADPDQWQEGLRIRPMILTDSDSDMKINHEETFGPVVTVTPFDSEEEAVRLANDSSYGLSASVWSENLQKAQQFATRLESGSVCINEVVSFVANPHLPFGGVKNSGIGRYHGESGLRSFCNEQSILIDRGQKRTEVNWFPYKGKLPSFRKLIISRFGEKTNWPQFL
ncbi:MAG TPA: aldehyde dehydrogenase family protein, partial [Bacillales bacterium]|nr:aldehyde dehydrogenase family protein [Bacillales bacterium]